MDPEADKLALSAGSPDSAALGLAGSLNSGTPGEDNFSDAFDQDFTRNRGSDRSRRRMDFDEQDSGPGAGAPLASRAGVAQSVDEDPLSPKIGKRQKDPWKEDARDRVAAAASNEPSVPAARNGFGRNLRERAADAVSSGDSKQTPSVAPASGQPPFLDRKPMPSMLAPSGASPDAEAASNVRASRVSGPSPLNQVDRASAMADLIAGAVPAPGTADADAAMNGKENWFSGPSGLRPFDRATAPADMASAMAGAPDNAGAQNPPLRGPSAEMESLLETVKKTRESMWSAVTPQVPQGMPQYPQQGMFAGHQQGMFPQVQQSVFPSQQQHMFPSFAVPQRMYVPQRCHQNIYVSPAPVVQTAPAPTTPPAAPLPPPNEPPPEAAKSPAKAAEPEHVSTDYHSLDNSQRDFQHKLQTMRSQLIPDLRCRRSELSGALQSTDAQMAEVRQRCLEAQRDGQAEFEALKAHLSSVENLKLAVLGRERDERARLVDGIDEVVKRVEVAASSSHSHEVVSNFLADFPELHANAQSLWSRSAALPQVEVGVDDIPFEARAKSDKLRKFAVMARLQQAKDVTLWRLEQQRRYYANEALEAAACQQHFEALLERYAEELSHTRAELMALTGGQPGSPSRHSTPPRGPPRFDSAYQDPYQFGPHINCYPDSAYQGGLHNASSDSTYQGAYQGGPHNAHSDNIYQCGLPWASGFAPPGGHHLSHQTDALLRKITQACDRSGVDIRSAFQAFDANQRGFISPQEFRDALSRLKIGASDEEVSMLLARLDTNADGMVSYEEFLMNNFQAARDPRSANVGAAFVEHFSGYDAAARALWQRVARAFRDRGVPLGHVFKMFDVDKDDFISRQDLLKAFQAMNLGLSDSDVERLLRDIDANEDGKVSFHEFVNRLK